MSSSSEATVLRGAAAGAAAPVLTPDLRSGSWTRYGDGEVRGDSVTEHTLQALASSAHAAAQAQGYAAGWAEGRQLAAIEAAEATAKAEGQHKLAEAQRELEHRDAVAALTTAASHLLDVIDSSVAQVEQQATELALSLVRELLGHELRVATSADVVRRVLRVLPDGPTARVRFAPGVVDDAVVADLAARGVAVVADPTLAPADAVVETDTSMVDLRISAAMERLAEALA